MLTAITSEQRLYAEDPLAGLLGERFRQNTTTGMIEVPLLIARGLFEPVVAATVQDQFVEHRHDASPNLDYRSYSGDHLLILSSGSPLVEDLPSWTEVRLRGEPRDAGCRRSSA